MCQKHKSHWGNEHSISGIRPAQVSWQSPSASLTWHFSFPCLPCFLKMLSRQIFCISSRMWFLNFSLSGPSHTVPQCSTATPPPAPQQALNPKKELLQHRSLPLRPPSCLTFSWFFVKMFATEYSQVWGLSFTTQFQQKYWAHLRCWYQKFQTTSHCVQYPRLCRYFTCKRGMLFASCFLRLN